MPSKQNARLIYADSEHCADMMYAVGLFVPDAFLWAQVGDDECIIVSPLEYGRAAKTVGDRINVISFSEAKKSFRLRKLRAADQIAGLSRAHQIKRWQVPRNFPTGLTQDLQRRGITCRAVDGDFFPARSIKSKEEVEKLRRGEELAEIGMYRAFEILHASSISEESLLWGGTELTSELLRGEIDAAISKAGGIAAHTIVACGPQGADPHNSGSGPIRPNQPLILDIFPRVTATGYFGDLTRTVIKGRAPEIAHRAFEAVRDARNLATQTVRAGVNGKQVHEVSVDTLKKHGFETNTKADPPCGFIHGTGHGVGLEIHESPRVSTADHILEAGCVHTVEPGLYYPEWGGIRLEDLIHVTADGHENLTSIETFLEID